MGVSPNKNFGLLLALLAVLFCNQLAAQIRPPTWPDVPLPEGPIRNILLDNCTSCHGIDDYAFFALDSQGWEDLLAEKHAGDSQVVTTNEEKAILLQYLSSNFGQDSIPFPRDYVPPERE